MLINVGRAETVPNQDYYNMPPLVQLHKQPLELITQEVKSVANCQEGQPEINQ